MCRLPYSTVVSSHSFIAFFSSCVICSKGKSILQDNLSPSYSAKAIVHSGCSPFHKLSRSRNHQATLVSPIRVRHATLKCFVWLSVLSVYFIISIMLSLTFHCACFEPHPFMQFWILQVCLIQTNSINSSDVGVYHRTHASRFRLIWFCLAY